MAWENPAGVPVVGPGTPYITPELLTSAPTGVAWSTIPGLDSIAAQQLAEQANMCLRATSQIDSYCNQPLRATVDTETWTGPGDFRCQLQPTGVVRLLASRTPVTFVVSARVSSAAAFPRAWQTIPANQLEPEIPLLGVYGTSAPGSAGDGGPGILVAPGWVTWGFGRASTRLEATYGNGWPHCSLTSSATGGGSSLVVDDITGWEDAAGIVFDSSGLQEYVSVSGVTPATAGAVSGAGTLTLSAPLTNSHRSGTMVTALPPAVQLAAVYLVVAQALTRGATATTVQSVSGGSSGGGTQSQEYYTKVAHELLNPFRRVW